MTREEDRTRISQLRTQIEALKSEFEIEIRQLRDEFSDEIRRVEDELSRAGDAVDSTADVSSSLEPGAEPVASETDVSPKPYEEPVGPDVAAPSTTDVVSEPARTSAWQFVITELGPLFRTVTGPLAILTQLAGQGLTAYRHYQEQGKAPVFLLTTAGIIALVLGFGYLLQYSFAYLLGEIAKLVLGFAIALSVTIYGGYLARNSREFGSAILGLGITLNYLCAYAAGPYYELLGPTAVFILYVAITGLGIAAGFLFETRIVAVIALLGGSVSPLIMNSAAAGGDEYFLVQLLIAFAYVQLANRIRWLALANLTFVATVLSVEYHLLALADTPSLIVGFCLHALFYLFSFYVLYYRVHRNSKVDRIDITLATSNILFFAAALWQLSIDETFLGIALVSNGVFLLAAFAVGRRLRWSVDSGVQPILLMSAGLLVGLGILALSGPRSLGVMWEVEGSLLVAAGFYFRFPRVRQEGYLLFAVGIVSQVTLLFEWFLTDQMSIDLDWAMWLLLGPFTILILRTMSYFRSVWDSIDQIVFKVAGEVLSVWISAFALITAFILLPEYWLPLAIIPMIILLFRAAAIRSEISNVLAVSHYLLLIVQIGVAVVESRSFLFRELSLPAKMAVLEGAAGFWLLQWFYETYFGKSRLRIVGEGLRYVFYLALPVFFIPRVVHSYGEFLPHALWASNLIAFVIYRMTSSFVVKYEQVALIYVASTFSLTYVLIETYAEPMAAVVLSLGLAFYGLVYYFENAAAGYKQLVSPYRQIIQLSPHYLAGSVFLVATLLSNPHWGLAITGAYYAVIVSYWPLLSPVRGSLKFTYALIMSIAAAAIALGLVTGGSLSPVANLVVLLSFGTLLYRKVPHHRLMRGMILPNTVKMWFLHVLVLCVYASASDVWLEAAFGPWVTVLMVAHATAILFSTLNVRLKAQLNIALTLYALALIKIFGFDLADFSVVEKVIAFVGVGILLLGSAYQFQKIRAPDPIIE